MRGMALAWLLVGVMVVGVPVPAAAQEVPRVPTTDPLPPLMPDDPAVDVSDVCGVDGLVCVRYVEEQLAGWEQRFGCDHRAVFPTVYRLLTRQTRLVLEDDPSFFDDPAGLGFEALAFYELYEDMITAHLAGEGIPDAWQVAMDVAAEGDWSAGHDMLLAINAHVQRDMPFAVARVGLVLPDGTSRKADHDRFNNVLNAAYPTIMREVARRYDPLVGDVESLPVADDTGAQQLVAGWREGVWRNAEALVGSEGTPSYEVVVAEIEANAYAWAEAIATGEIPGRRELRDAHCAAFLAEQQESDGAPPPTTSGDTHAAARRDGDRGSLPATGSGMAVLALGALSLWTLLRRR